MHVQGKVEPNRPSSVGGQGCRQRGRVRAWYGVLGGVAEVVAGVTDNTVHDEQARAVGGRIVQMAEYDDEIVVRPTASPDQQSKLDQICTHHGSRTMRFESELTRD